MCEIFQIHINFKELSIESICTDVESQEASFSLEFLGESVESTSSDEVNINLVNGCYPIGQCFILQPQNSFLENEDFAFKVFGTQSLKIKLVSKKTEARKRMSSKVETLFAEGSIKLTQNFKEFRCKSVPTSHQVSLKSPISENTIISLTYQINFTNIPEIDSSLSLSLIQLHNLKLLENDHLHACFRFPFNQQFRAALLYKSDLQSSDTSYLLDNLLKEFNFELDEDPSAINLSYENFQTACGLKLLHDLIKNNQRMLIELKIDDRMYMTFIDLTIFNHPDVCNVTFVVPLYEWNNKIILDQFQQEACLTTSEAASIKKRKSKRSLRDDVSIISEEVLKPIVEEGKHVALKIYLKFSKALYNEKSTEELFDELNTKFPFILEINEKDYGIQQSQKNFHCMINQMARVSEQFVIQNSELSHEELVEKFKSLFKSPDFCLKDEFKDALRTLIGNTFNQETKTETNHEFKLLVMKVFKRLSHKMNEILIERQMKKLDGPRVFLDDNTRKWQMKEYIECKKYDEAQKLLERELSEDLNELKMKEKAYYLFKLKKFDKLECLVKKLLRISKYCTFSLYILLCLFVLKNDSEMAIIILRILTKLKPSSMEYWILLSDLYEKNGYTAGIQFCELKIQDSKFMSNCNTTHSVIHPEMLLLDPIVSIQWNQFKFEMLEFLEVTKKYEKKKAATEKSFERFILEIIELFENKDYENGLKILRSINMDDDNEITVRILKGNILYELNEQWKAICEYEIAYNLSQKFKLDFPLIPALRCGNWFLNETENFQKSKKYFRYCCNAFGTFESLMGMGKVCLKFSDFHGAESFFKKAHSIEQNSSENWIFLALTYCKLDQMNMALRCYLTAKEFGAKETKELIEIEEYLDI